MPCEVSNGFAGHRLFIEKSPVFQLADDSAEVAGVIIIFIRDEGSMLSDANLRIASGVRARNASVYSAG